MVLSIYESDFKRGLRELNSSIHFDMGTAQGGWHPRQGEAQGIFYQGRHLCGMGRGVVPEWDRYDVDSYGDRTMVLAPGWRTIFNKIANRGIPGVSWQTLGEKFDIGYVGPANARYEVA